MTGFGQGGAAMGSGRVVAEARSVNGRFLEVRVKMARELGDAKREDQADIAPISGALEVSVEDVGCGYSSKKTLMILPSAMTSRPAISSTASGVRLQSRAISLCR